MDGGIANIFLVIVVGMGIMEEGLPSPLLKSLVLWNITDFYALHRFA